MDIDNISVDIPSALSPARLNDSPSQTIRFFRQKTLSSLQREVGPEQRSL